MSNKALIDAINDLPSSSVTFRVEKDGTLRAFNFSAEFCRMAHCSKEEAYSFYPVESVFKDIHPEDREAMVAFYSTHKQDLVPSTACCRIALVHGGYLWVSLTFSILQIEDYRYVYVVFTDIDDLKEREKELEQDFETAQNFMSSLTESYISVRRSNITQNRHESINLIGTSAVIAPTDGYDEATEKVLANVLDPKEHAECVTYYSREATLKAFDEGTKTLTKTYRMRLKSGAIHWVKSVIKLLRRNDGDLIAFATLADVNQEVINDFLAQKIITMNYSTVAYYEPSTATLYVKSTKNSFAAKFNAVSYEAAVKEAIAGQVTAEDIPTCVRGSTISVIREELQNKTVFTFYYTKKEEANSFALTSKRMKCDVFYLDESATTIVFLFSDVTAIVNQEKEARSRLEIALASAEQASLAKTQFLSRMSHEIRTPMNAIIGLDAIAMQEQGLTPALEDHLQKIGISARFLLSLINDILDMSRIESGKMVLKEELFNFEELITGINTILYEQCQDNGLDYECILKSATQERYLGDVTKLQQVLVNILGNAVKFTPKGGKVTFSIEETAKTKTTAHLRFQIADTGIGIDESFLPNLFQPFSQENRGKTSPYGGSGLGLAISKNIITLMGGKIGVNSIKNVGTEFTIDVDLGLSPEQIDKQALKGHLKPLSTLIVDDDVVICEHTQLILNEAGLSSEWASSGDEAIAKVQAHHDSKKDYDLILLDWKMPDKDGLETAKEIRQIVGPDVTIIIMTAYDWADIEKEAHKAGVDYFMRKPVFISSITQAFEQVFLLKKQPQPLKERSVFDFKGKRILLAEDNAINAEIAKTLLTSKNAEVLTVVNGEEAVRAFQSAPLHYYDAILMDVRMPKMDGLEATKAIRALKRDDAKTTPILAMTANAFQEDINQSLAAGMNEHLAKPIEPLLLYRALQKYLFPSK